MNYFRISSTVLVVAIAMIMFGSCMASFGGGGFNLDFGSLFSKNSHPAGYVRTKAYIEESPEIGFSIQKIPIVLPLPTLILRKAKHLVTRPISMSVCSGCGGGGYGGMGGGYGGGEY